MGNRPHSRRRSKHSGRAHVSSVWPFRARRNGIMTSLLLGLAARIRRIGGAAIRLRSEAARHRRDHQFRRAARPDGRRQRQRQHERSRDGIPPHGNQLTRLSRPRQFFARTAGFLACFPDPARRHLARTRLNSRPLTHGAIEVQGASHPCPFGAPRLLYPPASSSSNGRTSLFNVPSATLR